MAEEDRLRWPRLVVDRRQHRAEVVCSRGADGHPPFEAAPDRGAGVTPEAREQLGLVPLDEVDQVRINPLLAQTGFTERTLRRGQSGV